MTRNSRRLQKAVQAIFNDYREKASCPGQVYQNAACGCDNALQMWRGPKGEKGDTGPQGPKGDNAGSFLVDAEFVVDPEGQEPGAYLKLVLIDVAQQEQVVYVDLSYLTDIYTGGNGIDITSMVVAAKLGAGLTFDANGNIASAYQFCDGLDETSNVVKVRLDASNRILGFASGTCGGLTATVGLAPSATGVNLVLTGANGAVLSTVPLEGGTGITVQKNAQTGGFTWLADPAGLVSSQTGNQLSVSQTDNKLYVGGNTLEYTFGTGAFTLKDSSGATLSSVTVPSAVRMLENMELRTDDGIYLHLTYLRDNGLHAYQDVSLDELLCNNVDTADDTAAAYSKAVPSGNWQTASINEVGGRTVVWNQLVQNGDFSDGTTGWTASNNTFGTYGASLSITEGELVISSTLSTNQMWGVKHSCNFNAGHKYAIIGNIRRVLDVKSDPDITKMVLTLHGDTTESVITYQTPSATTYSLDGIFTSTYNNSMFSLRTIGNIQLASASVAIFSILRLFIIDLTLMFGAGNEPATVAEFQSMFPAAYYPYNAGELRSAGVTDVESKGRNLIDKENVPFLNCYISTDGYITANAYDRLFYVPIEPNTVYTFQCALTLTDGTSLSVVDVFTGFTDSLPVSGLKCLSFNKYLAQQTISASYTSPATAKYFVCKIAQTQRVVLNATMDTVQLERGSTATAYTPYFSRTLPIPAAIQALPGYGWSAGTAYNVVSLAQGKNTQKVGSVDLGSLTYIKTSMGVGDVFVSTLSDAKPVSVNTDIFNGISSAFKTVSRATFNSTSSESLVALNTLAQLILYTTVSYTDATAFKSAMSGVMLQYELAAPVETGISSLLTDNLIEVEPGGTLTFKNQHGDAFRLPVPNSETFIYEHLWVFEDCVKGAMQPAIDALNARIDDVSVELITLDAECREVTVEPATAEPFDDYLLSGSINTLLLEPDGTISDLKHHNAIPDSSTVRGSVTMELFNPESTDGLSIELYAKQSSSSDSRNYYSNVDPEADAQKCATLADFLAAGEQGLPLTYADETSFSGVTPFAENETLYASVVSNGNNSYTFTFTVRAPEVKETRLILDLVSGENRTDLKPLLEHVGGKIDMVAVPSGDAVQLSFGYAGAGYIFGSRRSDFPTVGLFANSAEDICAQTNLIQPTSVGPGADTFTYYFETLPTHFAIPSISEVDATGTKVGTTSYASPMLDMETMRCTGEGTALADIPEAGLVYTEYDTSSRPFVPTGRTLRLRATVGNAGIVFTLWQQETVDKPVLCLEPSCDSCIDLSPVMDTVDEMIDKKIAEIPQYEGATASAAGTDGLVPAATSAEKDMFLKGDGTWEALPTNHVTTDTNQTITGVKTFGAGVYGNVVAMSAGAIDVSAGTVFTKTITANTTISFSNVPAAPATACVTLILTNGGAYTVTWPSSVKWNGGTAPTLTSSGVDILTFLTVDGGTTWYGSVNLLGAA